MPVVTLSLIHELYTGNFPLVVYNVVYKVGICLRVYITQPANTSTLVLSLQGRAGKMCISMGLVLSPSRYPHYTLGTLRDFRDTASFITCCCNWCSGGNIILPFFQVGGYYSNLRHPSHPRYLSTFSGDNYTA